MAARPSPRKKYAPEPPPAPKRPLPGIVWMLTGCALTAFVMFLMQLPKQSAPGAAAPAAPANAAPAAKVATAPSKPEPPKPAPAAEPEAAAPTEAPVITQKPRYDFYRLLKENRTATGQNETSPTGSTAATADAHYLLQIASYKTLDDAQGLRAKLVLLNLDARIENVTLRNGEIWHRVLIGPLKTHAELTRVRGVLNDNKYDSLVLKNNKPATP